MQKDIKRKQQTVETQRKGQRYRDREKETEIKGKGRDKGSEIKGHR